MSQLPNVKPEPVDKQTVLGWLRTYEQVHSGMALDTTALAHTIALALRYIIEHLPEEAAA